MECVCHYLIEPLVMPLIMCFCMEKKKISNGIMLMTSAASAKSHCFVYWPKKKNVANGIVRNAGSCRTSIGSKKSFQIHKLFKMMIVTVIGFNNGKTILQKTLNGEQPSIIAASSSSTGIPFIKPWYKKMAIPIGKGVIHTCEKWN